MDNYLFQAAPKAVQTRTRKAMYRGDAEEKEAFGASASGAFNATSKAANLMYDRRVSRGSTYAPSKRTQPLPVASFRPVPQAAQAHSRHGRESMGSAAKQHPLPPSSAQQQLGGLGQHASSHNGGGDVDFIRIATPEPVAGRVHTTVQTDTYLEDLRRARSGAGNEFATQTDAENDRPTLPLFIPRSSGDDVATEIESNALFDYELEVQAILGVLVEKSLEQALMEVMEEEEMAELASHQAAFQQEKNRELIAVQQLVQRDERRQAERDRRAAQEAARIAEAAKTAAKRHAATVSKQLVARMQDDILAKLEAQGQFYDPVKREVETVFMPQLMAATAKRLQQHQIALDCLDNMIAESITAYRAEVEALGAQADEQQVAALVKYLLAPDAEKGPRPQQGIRTLANKIGRAEEDLSHRAAQLSAASASAAAAAAASAGRNAALPFTPDERASAIVAGIRAEREAARKAEEKQRADIVRIQALQRGKRDRARAQKLADKRRLEAERAAMSPQELLASLANHLGFKVALQSAPAAAAASSSSSTADEHWVVSSLEPLGPASQAGLVRGDRILSFGAGAPAEPTPLTASTASILNQDMQPQDSEDRAPLGALKSAPYNLNPGSLLMLEVERALDGRRETVGVEIGCAEEGFSAQETIRDLREQAELPAVGNAVWHDRESALAALQKLPGKLGATVGELKALGGTGARLSKVAADSAAARATLQEGDVVLSMGGDPVDSKELTAALKDSLAGDVIALEVLAPSALEKLTAAAGGDSARKVSLKSLGGGSTLRKQVELGGGGKKYTVEQVRSLRRMAGLEVFGEQ